MYYSFSAQLAEIKEMTLAKIMCENDGIKDIQPDVFRVVNNGLVYAKSVMFNPFLSY